MNETIRAYIKRRVRWCMAIGVSLDEPPAKQTQADQQAPFNPIS